MPTKSVPKLEKKQDFFDKLIRLVEKYSKIIIVVADHVGSHHMQTIRTNLRAAPGENVILMGKNTLIRKAIKGHLAKSPALEALLPHVKGNVGFVFTVGELATVRKEIESNRVSAPAKVGAIAPTDVIVPKGPTGLDPQQTAFMQALNINTKINRAQVEILEDVHLLRAGDKVDSSKATLLAKLNIRPFSYGLTIKSIYDSGAVYEPAVLDIRKEDLIAHFLRAIQLVAQLSLATGQPSAAAIPHYLANAYRDLIAISVETDYTFEGAAKIKEILADPEAFAAAAAAAAATAAASTTTSAKTKETTHVVVEKPAVVEEEEKEEEDADIGGLFGFGDD